MGPKTRCIEQMLEQIRRVTEGQPPTPDAPRLTVPTPDSSVLTAIPALTAQLATMALPPLDLRLSIGVEDLPAPALLERAAADLAGSPHRLLLDVTDVRSFSPPERHRYGLDPGPTASLTALRSLRQLGDEPGGHVRMTEGTGLDVRLYSPWTTLEDIALNLAILRHFALLAFCGDLLGGKLLFPADHPLVPQARRDGLLFHAAEEVALPGHAQAAPAWRFQDPRVARFYTAVTQWAVRQAHGAPPRPLALWDAPLQDSAISLAQRLCDGLGQGLPEAELRALLHRDHESAGEAPERAEPAVLFPSSAPRARSATAPDVTDPFRRPDLRAFAAHVKPLCVIEPLTPAQADSWKPSIQTRGPEAWLLDTRRETPSGEVAELLVSWDPSQARELAALRETSPSDRGHAEEVADTERRMGTLLGYPACCVEAHTAVPAHLRRFFNWQQLRNRVNHPGPFPPALHPWLGAPHVVCSTACAPSHRIAAAARELLTSDRVVAAIFGQPGDAQGQPPFLSAAQGVLRVAQDTRSAAQRATVPHQVERALGFHFARALPAQASWRLPGNRAQPPLSPAGKP